MSYGGKGSGRQKCSVTMKITIWCCIQGKYGSHVESIHTIAFTVKTVQMQCYLVIWPWATTLSLHFFIGRIITDTIYWVLTLSQACWGMLGICYLMQSFGLAAPGNGSCAAANIIVRTEQDHGEKQWTQRCTYQQVSARCPSSQSFPHLTNGNHKRSNVTGFAEGVLVKACQGLYQVPVV